ncbi:molybdate ABC transporter substrate-binding protein [Planococcus salinarum]|uniref:Molybdate ABC transporter substrate-binding protein n=1 Tax=Planococcus salinarum TaxID=622695 RepID=A0ABX3D1W3_9BACL|nr:molybdate ABC transporter substrate-binding protein [Planococcus salinarum]OHX53914.1 molybdate ABC transporter substrate-binding protein [Planococcus salinarum]TAA73031.1 molybdate ABC transporter substrate-binding protein [Planococcus salinarum]
MRLINKLLVLAFAAGILGGCTANPSAEQEILMVSAASSLSGVVEELTAGFNEDNPAVEIVANYGSSSKLRNQIENGAPADVFLSASTEDMETLVEKGLATKDSVAPFARNGLLIAASSDIEEGAEVEAVLSSVDGTVAIAEPASVPLGGYSKRSLEALDIWQSLEGKLIYAKDARQVVTYLESGNAKAGIIYASDAKLSAEVADMSMMPLGSEEILYPAAMVAASSQQEHADKFLSYILSEEGQQIIADFGFMPIEGKKP